jgi:hypothetical protein
MLLTLENKGSWEIQRRMVRIRSLTDNLNYPFRNDPRIIPRIDDADIPLVTILTGFLAVHVLRRMHELEPVPSGKGYLSSLREADDMITKWCGLFPSYPP